MAAEARWTKGLEFRVDYPTGESLELASLPLDKRPGPGPSPMEAVQAAMAGCTGMDVISILEKMRKLPTSLRIVVDARRRDEHPRIYTHMLLTYYLEGPDLDEASAIRAVHLSQEKYCSVAAMLRPTVELGYRIQLNGKLVETASAITGM